MTEQEIIDKVRVILNEAGEENTLTLLSEDTVKLSDYIRESIPDAVALVQKVCTHRSVNTKRTSPSVSASGYGCSFIKPTDFIRLNSVKMKSWKRACHMTYNVSSEEYKRQFNEFTKAGINKPLCFISSDSEGEKLLLFPYRTDDTMDYFVYEAKYSSDTGLSLSDCDPIALAVCYTTASLVYSIFENKSSADVMMQLATQYISKD